MLTHSKYSFFFDINHIMCFTLTIILNYANVGEGLGRGWEAAIASGFMLNKGKQDRESSLVPALGLWAMLELCWNFGVNK